MNLFKIEWTKILKGAAIAGGGAAMTYLSVYFGNADFGVYAPTATALFAIVINILRKLGTANG